MKEVLNDICCDLSAGMLRRAWDRCVEDTGREPDTLIYTSEDIPYVNRIMPEVRLIIDDQMIRGTWMLGVADIPFFYGSLGA